MADQVSVDTLTSTTFDEVIRSSTLPVLIDFWAENCPPCVALAPVLDELAEEHREQIRVVKVDTDAEPDIAVRFGVMAVPTLVVMHNNRLVRQLVGGRSKRQLVEDLGDLLKAPAEEQEQDQEQQQPA